MTAPGRPDPRSLPSRDLFDVRLADLLGKDGCPVCRARAAAENRFLDSWLYERVQDVRTRRELDETRGLCEDHIHALLAADRARAGGGLGTSILHEAMLRVRLAELVHAHGARGRGRGKRLAEAAAPPACLVCREVAGQADATLDGLRAHLPQSPWADAIATAELCLAHLTDLARRCGDDERWRPVEARQLARLHDLAERLRLFGHHAAADRRHLRTPEQEASVDEGTRFLGGDRRPTS